MAENTRTSPRDFVSEVVEQVKKVTWPDRAQLQSSTGIIVGFMLAMGAIIFGIDTVVRTVLDAVSSLFAS
ncbi:preprotein translocase subunit SecE [Longimicrobium sp.]|uniref:preprotein translocase subunit SecE n=1 Tax=Longimicrobium sp. TaxID=2029185 RepID=UPI002E2EEEF5|nr:preprotein translocase subunit SecE [Longimicrobium sp.]HEX6039973.1 preprotein translocase subunit SecE [Longimicrobium sp.]